jgi:capsular polysaccharide transport system permease protein
MPTNIIRKRSSIEVLRDVLFALFIREIKTRFGAYRLGIVWAFVEPFSFVLIMSAIRSLGSSGSLFGGVCHSIPVPFFYMLAYVPFLLFSSLLTQSVTAINANRGLFNYKQVRPIDTLLARTLLEVFVYCFVILCFMAIFWWFGFDAKIESPLTFIATLSLLTVLGGSIGLMVCTAQIRFPEIGKLVPILSRPLFFISGLFFSLNDIPEKLHHYLLWNPVLHAIELIRQACYGSYPADEVSLTYLAFLTLLFAFFGLALYRLDWKHMVAS